MSKLSTFEIIAVIAEIVLMISYVATFVFEYAARKRRDKDEARRRDTRRN